MASSKLLWVTIGAAAITVVIKILIPYLTLLYKTRQHGCESPPAYPHKEPFLGLDLFFNYLKEREEGNSEEKERERFKRLCKTYKVNAWGSRYIMTMDKANIRAVTSDSFSKFGVQPIRLDIAVPFIAQGVFTTDGVYWERSRKLLKPILGRLQTSDLDQLDVHVKRVLQRIPTDGTTVELQSLLNLAFLDHAAESIFGESTDTLLHPELGEDASELLHTYNAALSKVGLRLLFGRLWFLGRYDWSYNKLAAKIHAVIDKYLDRAIERQQKKPHGSSQSRTSVIDEIAGILKDREEIRHQLLNLFLPTRDAVAAGLSGVLFHLARHPRVWDKLRAEVMALEGKFSSSTLQSMPYMKAVLNESLRLTIPATANIRICTKDCVLPSGGGPSGKSPVFVSKGDQVCVHFGAMHYDEDIWGRDAAQFRPERWENLQPGWSYMPFSAGPRICPGQQIALVQSAFVLVRLMQSFEKMENRDPEIKLIERQRLTVESRNGVLVSLTPARKNGRED